MRRALTAVLSATATLILVGVVLGYGGGVVFELDVLAHFRLHFALIAAALAAGALALRAPGAGFRLVAASVLALAGLGPLAEPASRPGDRPGAEPGAGRALTVLTANLFQGNPEPESLAAALLAADADIVVTHETGRFTQSGPASLAQHYDYRLQLGTTGPAFRTVLWSRFPMREGALFLEDRIEPTGARAVVDLGDGVLVGVLGVHLAHTLPGNQAVQIAALDRIVEPLPPTRIVMGDFNTTPWSWGMMRVAELTATRRVGGYRITWQGAYETPLGELPALLGQPIDHVLVSPDIAVEAVETIALPGSDHLGVLARLRIPDA